MRVSRQPQGVDSVFTHRIPSGIVASHPKTGRTWLRFMLAHYLGQYFGSSNTEPLNMHNMYDFVPNYETDAHGRGLRRASVRRDVPLIAMDHSRPRLYQHKSIPVVLLIRDPRDVAVSHWHHAKWHYANTDAPNSLSEFVSDAWANNFFEHFESWMRFRRTQYSRLMITSYEAMYTDTVDQLTAIVQHMAIAVSPELIRRAVHASEFSTMQAIELRYGIRGIQYDRTNRNARRVRSGTIGSHHRHLDSFAAARIASAAERILSHESKVVLARLTNYS
nr:sulfotransferase domain-containing protein [Mycobacteroides abscessus]